MGKSERPVRIILCLFVCLFVFGLTAPVGQILLIHEVSRSIGLSSLAFFYLLTRVFFKAVLFIYAGDVIHSIGDSQDVLL